VLLPVIAARARRLAAGRIVVALACAAVPFAVACGKKGPPLAPLARLPVAPSQVSASRAADEVVIRFAVPAANVSGVRPADIERVDVYAWTGPDLPAERLFKVATVVASVAVRPPPPPQDPDDEGAVPPPPPVGPGVDQGASTELAETLAAEAFEPIDPPDPSKTSPPIREPKVTPADAVPPPPPLTRRYVVVGVNRGGRRGPPAAAVAVPLWPAPPPPTGVTAKAVETGTMLTWTPPANLRRAVMASTGPAPAALNTPRPEEPTAGAAQPAAVSRAGSTVTGEPLAAGGGSSPNGLLPARLAVPWPAVTIGYHVYEVLATAPATAASAQPSSPISAPPRRLTTAPVKETTFADTRVEYGVERCYLVRTVETIGTLSVESAWSAPACLKAADVFPPPSPKSLAAVASEGAISLIWEGSSAPDLAGYVVTRGIAPGAPAERLTPQPIRETTFRDTSVTPGTRYVYAVTAVDTAIPANASAPSNLVEETAR
jgi:hypothetical protein